MQETDMVEKYVSHKKLRIIEVKCVLIHAGRPIAKATALLLIDPGQTVKDQPRVDAVGCGVMLCTVV